jgi:prevent-host-death family protein
MKELALYEVKTRLSELINEVESGEQFVITRRGVAVARLVGAAAPVARRSQVNAQRLRVAEAFEALAQLRQGVVLDMPVRQAIEAGRD